MSSLSSTAFKEIKSLLVVKLDVSTLAACFTFFSGDYFDKFNSTVFITYDSLVLDYNSFNIVVSPFRSLILCIQGLVLNTKSITNISFEHVLVQLLLKIFL